MRPVLLIAPREILPLLQEQPALTDVQAFTDTQPDQDRVIAAITQQECALLYVESQFATTPRGRAFVTRVQSSDAGSKCEIKTVSVRRATRHKLRERVFLDGEPATLLDISTTGAALVSAVPLKPQQPVRVTLREGDRPLSGTTIWVQFELPRDGPRYRAGIEFVGSDAAILAEYSSETTR